MKLQKLFALANLKFLEDYQEKDRWMTKSKSQAKWILLIVALTCFLLFSYGFCYYLKVLPNFLTKIYYYVFDLNFGVAIFFFLPWGIITLVLGIILFSYETKLISIRSILFKYPLKKYLNNILFSFGCLTFVALMILYLVLAKKNEQFIDFQIYVDELFERGWYTHYYLKNTPDINHLGFWLHHFFNLLMVITVSPVLLILLIILFALFSVLALFWPYLKLIKFGKNRSWVNLYKTLKYKRSDFELTNSVEDLVEFGRFVFKNKLDQIQNLSLIKFCQQLAFELKTEENAKKLYNIFKTNQTSLLTEKQEKTNLKEVKTKLLDLDSLQRVSLSQNQTEWKPNLAYGNRDQHTKFDKTVKDSFDITMEEKDA
ncbi:hypothetical protein [Mycoplasmopsis gallopavonis]|uniref:Uncharacterized protein n=1 Tax=Mycoplasmopsis gallopavonis TaxID=76629 RepID=A0A449AYZ9_9BACT|nr:hypothetical protein [Mycoplasmopsis gallopavonis]RIV16577.1 hypothetical protein D1113_01745 [Mycoplasmopsis gallopavonis]VEU72707.1 Uncharacterised protein [Mycoplasmopsis gallopavonis]